MFAFFLMVTSGLCYHPTDSSQSILGLPRLTGPSVAILKQFAQFFCELPNHPSNETILFQLFKEGNRSKLLAESTSLSGEAGSFPIQAELFHEGNLECEARAQNNSVFVPAVSPTHHLRVIIPVNGAEVFVQSGPENFLEGRTLKLNCELNAGNHVTYKWLLNGRPFSQSPDHYAIGDHLVIHRTTSADSGLYMCVATNHFNSTEFFTANSSEVLITVEDVVSNPEISFTVLKQDSHTYFAEVTCQSERGTPPVTFSLHNRTELVTYVTVQGRKATFRIPLAFDQFLGWLQCQARNRDHVTYSQWLPLEVERVGGPVMMHYEYSSGDSYAITDLTIYCKAMKGSHRRYRWFRNKTLLHERGSFHRVLNQSPEQSILLLSVGRSSAGTYHCEVSDSFDNVTAISSRKHYFDMKGLNRLHVLVVATIFGCVTFILVLLCVCCCIGAAFRRRQYGEKSLSALAMRRMEAAYEGELDLSEFSEDAGVVETARGDEFDQESAASGDEWP